MYFHHIFLHKLHIVFCYILYISFQPRSPSTRPCGGEGLRRDLLAFYAAWRKNTTLQPINWMEENGKMVIHGGCFFWLRCVVFFFIQGRGREMNHVKMIAT